MWLVLFVAASLADSDEAFGTAVCTLIETGYVPELAYSPQEALSLLGPAPQVGGAEQLRFGRRLRELAPEAEGVAAVFRELKRRAGSSADKAFFAEAERDAQKRTYLAPLGTLADRVAYLFHFWLAVLIGGTFWLLCGHRDKLWLPVLAAALIAPLVIMVPGMAALQALRDAPPQLRSGRLDDDAVRAYIGDARSEVALLAGLARDGLPKSATTLTHAAAKLLREGDKKGARGAYQEAHALAPEDIAASFGVWRTTGTMPPQKIAKSQRFDRALRCNLGALISTPSDAAWQQLFAQKNNVLALGKPTWIVVLGALWAFGLLYLVWRRIRAQPTPETKWTAYWPGAGERGTLVLAVVAAALLIVAVTRFVSHESTPYLAMVTTDPGLVYGLAAEVPRDQSAWGFLALVVINAVMVYRRSKRGS